MTDVILQAQDELADVLAAQQQVYDRANALIGPLPDMISQEVDVNHVLNQLEQLMSLAADNEVVLRQKWEEWQALKQPAPEALHAAWQHAEASLRELVAKVEQITNMTQTTRDALLPNVHATATQRQMRMAYGR